MSDKEAFDKLAQILLDEERTKQKELQSELQNVKTQLLDPQNFAQKVEPLVQEKIESLKQTFPDLFGPLITQAIQVQIRDSQDEVVKVLYPIMGKLIKKYINSEFEKLKDNVNKRLDEALSFDNYWRAIRAKFKGVKTSELILADIFDSNVEQVLVIQKETGKLIGEYSSNPEGVDREIVASMLSIIKNFMEDAFEQKDQDLETIEYGTKKLLIHSSFNFFIVSVLNGELKQKLKKVLKEKLTQFSNQNHELLSEKDSEKNYQIISNKLETIVNI